MLVCDSLICAASLVLYSKVAGLLAFSYLMFLERRYIYTPEFYIIMIRWVYASRSLSWFILLSRSLTFYDSRWCFTLELC
jgi:hypothetical protein